jgi:hypothetical protein
MAGTPLPGGVVAINLIPLRRGASIDAFCRFSAERDQPTCLGRDVVEGFDAFAVRSRSDNAPAIDVVEVMRVRSWEEWVRTRDALPQMADLTREFDALVDAAAVRTLFATAIDLRT